MNEGLLVILLLFLPLVTFVVNRLFIGKKWPMLSGYLATLILIITTLLSVVLAWQYYFEYGKINGAYALFIPIDEPWLSFSNSLSINFTILVDALSVMMVLVVNIVSLMVHIFSLAYMKGEDRYGYYYAYLDLFTFAMLGLVLSGNIFELFIFWELVGISSYLLIGFYYTKPEAVAAAKKAFIVTRFADFGFLIGILLLGSLSNQFDIVQMVGSLTSQQTLTQGAGMSFIGLSALTWACLLLFMGAAGKSAMFPLHIWLPDAMEGPTPVSALIHAATMVVAGVFLIARFFPIFQLDGTILAIVGMVGAFTAFFAAIIACTQTDIKRVLAFSTISQIGYMMLALGVDDSILNRHLGYTAALFHLFTHAFFKSLLFLCAGAIIHTIHTNNMLEMGGLRKLLPVTHIGFLVGCLAIAGVPPFSGFFSKEAILFAAYQQHKWLYAVALITAFITSFYMFRLYFSIFWNKPVKNEHAHEGNWLIKLPLLILIALVIVTGFIPFGNFVSANGKPLLLPMHIGFSVIPVLLALLGIVYAAILYFKESNMPASLENSFGLVYSTVKHKFYIDELYQFITHKIIFNGIGNASAWIDKQVIDKLVNVSAGLTFSFSIAIKKLQSGKVQQYLLIFIVGILCLFVLFLV
ncbi:NADH-quinone oxidoreductase subunit L [Hydrotalea sp.]|uniref:NADH-quinone oxidoreductase subunit L n=1 Tax=Hydrotalea sp. TaxID=2881279 RepID=UPI003D0B3001